MNEMIRVEVREMHGGFINLKIRIANLSKPKRLLALKR